MLCVLAVTVSKGLLTPVLTAPSWHSVFGEDWELKGKRERLFFMGRRPLQLLSSSRIAEINKKQSLTRKKKKIPLNGSD